MIPGTRVEVVASWSSFLGLRGHVTKAAPRGDGWFVLLDGERLPLAFGWREVVPVDEPQHIASGE